MTPLPPRTRRRSLLSGPVRAARRLGEIRRAQLITTYGVGAMIAVDNESFLVRGIDSWDVSQAPVVVEPRLSDQLHVYEFRLPPAPDPDLAKDGVRAVRFPEWYSCPRCGALQPYRKFNSPAGRAECSSCQESLVPSRFVMACANGHLEDFPYWQWVHRNNGRTETGSCGGGLTFRSDGSTASLRAVLISCSCGVSASMEGSFRRTALDDLRIRCGGRLPWLKDAPAEHCTEAPRTLQRGSSSVWFPVLHSALSIPPWSEGMAKLAAGLYSKLKDEEDSFIRRYLQVENILEHHPAHDPEEILALIRERRETERSSAEQGPTESGQQVATDAPRTAIYRDEYDSLRRTHREDPEVGAQDFVCEPPVGSTGPLRESHGLGQIMLVKRLREVRALQSFTRIEEPGLAAMPRHAPIWHQRQTWLPAIEVRGEGVFLRLDTDRLRRWEQLPGPISRAQRIRANHDRLLHERAKNSDRPVPSSHADPRYVLLHTLAHVLINEWSLDGGYPAAALRERLYAGDDMAGILIYTATSDSAGSLGGIVAQGEPDRLESSLRSALDRAGWCSNDPLCAESEASGADGLNLAACHACVLLPETSCENNNILLDRAALIGSLDGSSPGFF
ncbi:DrmB family protein [Kitasatospora sp. NPDC059673]|uniref:DrmB family protein n=1 Tax=Kitasatospora sp. NPDC059673 TaxID=3346901 RepID=UPI0036982B2B